MYDDNACCRDFAELIILRHYGELGPDESATVEAHLLSCPACRKYAEELSLALAAVPAYVPTPWETSRAVSGVMARITPPVKAKRAWARRLAPALAAALLVALGLAFGIQNLFTSVQKSPVDQVLLAKADWDEIENIDVINDLDVVVAMDNIEDTEQPLANKNKCGIED